MKEGRQEILEMDTLVDEVISSNECSSSKSDMSKKDSDNYLEVMGVILKRPVDDDDVPNMRCQLKYGKLSNMLPRSNLKKRGIHTCRC